MFIRFTVKNANPFYEFQKKYKLCHGEMLYERLAFKSRLDPRHFGYSVLVFCRTNCSLYLGIEQ
jgi:hypothetical protein